MELMKIGRPIPPGPLKPSEYAVSPDLVEKRAALSLSDIVSVRIRDLFPDMPEPIFPSEAGISTVRKATEVALRGANMSMIRPEHSVNILASHHGFVLFGGEPYTEMIKTLRDTIHERTGCRDIRLRAGVGLRFRETEEYIERFRLDDYFGRGKAIGVAPVDEGIPIETEIGTLYGLKKVYDADWIVHAHNTDVREIHFHRMVDRAVKPFGMSYARIETRSTYHQDLGPRAANFVARAIFDSPFVQSKWSFSCFLSVSPSGITGVDVDNDLYALNNRVTKQISKTYGKLMTLLSEIDECIVVLDSVGPVPYTFAGGVIFANFCSANVDVFDLDVALPPYTWYTEAWYDKRNRPLSEDVVEMNPAIKMLVINSAWTGYPSEFWPVHIPTIVVGQNMVNHFRADPQNSKFMDHVVVASDLPAAIEFAKKTARTEKILIFDGASGGINVSRPLAELLVEKAPKVARKVEKDLMPKWLAQRGLGS